MTQRNIGYKLSISGDAQVKNALAGVGGSMQSVSNAAGQLVSRFAAVLGVGATFGKLVAVQREFDVLNSSLKTVTGSSAAAEREMAWIKQFAKETPFGLAQATQGFVKMKALGLDPSRAALTSFGNTASAMGKDLNQMIEAVADASTGEFERLKEFGVKAKKEGDRVSLTFQGVTTNIGNNAADIQRYLQAIGDNQFAGAMAERAQTLDGAIASLGDTWDELFRTISAQNAGTLIHDSVRLAEGAVSDLTAIIQALNTATVGNANQTGVMATALEGLAIVFETVAVMGVNLKYVLVSIGREIGGIAAQAAAVLRLDFSGAQAIGAAMREDAQRAAEQLEANERRILSARAIAKSLEGASGLDDPVTRRARASAEAAEQAAKAAAAKQLTDAQSKAAAAVKAKELALRAAEAAAKQYQGVLDGLTKTNIAGQIAAQGFTGAQAKFLEMAASPEWAKYSNAQRAQVAALYEVQIGQEQAAQAVKAHKQAQEEATKAHLDGIKALNSSAQAVVERLQAMKDEAQAIALAEQLTISLDAATEVLTIKRLEEKQAQMLGNEDAVLALDNEIKARRELLQLIGGKDAAEAAKKAAEESEKLRASELAEWQKTWDQVSQSFTDALMKGGKSVSEYLKGLFRTLVLRPILEPIGKSFAGLLGAGGAGSAFAGSVGGMGGLFNPGGTPLNPFGAGMGGALGGALGAFGSGLASGFGSILSAGIGGWATAAGSLIGTGALAGIASGIGMLAGPIGVAAVLLKSAFGRGPKVTQASGISGEFTTGGADLQNFTDWTRKGGWFRSNKSGTDYSAISAETDQFFDSSVRSLSSAARAYAQVLGMTGDAINDVTQTVRIDLKGLDEAAQKKAIQEAFVGFGDLLAQNLGVQSLEALEALASSLTSVNQVLASLGQSGFGASIAGGQGAQSLAALFGGVQQFEQSASAYLAAYYSEAERTALTTQQLTQQFAALGLSMPRGIAGLRSLIEAQDKNTESGRAAYAALIQLSPAFASVANAAAEQAQAAALKLVAQFVGANGAAAAIGSVSQAALLMASRLGSEDGGQDGSVSAALHSISAVLGNTRSGVLTFGQAIGRAVGPAALSPSQRAVAGLHAEIDALSRRAGPSADDVRALSASLQSLDTASFSAAIVSLFESIAERLRGVFDDVLSERVAVRQAAIGIIDPQAYSYSLLQSQIASQRVALPSDASLRSANAALGSAAASKDQTDAALSAANAEYSRAASALSSAQASFSATKSAIVAAEARENAAFAQIGFGYGGGFTIDANGRPVWSSSELNGQASFGFSGLVQRQALSAMRGGSWADWQAWQQSGAAFSMRDRYDPNAPWNLLETLGRTYNTDLASVNSATARSGSANAALQSARSAAAANSAAMSAAEAKQRSEAAKYAAALTQYAAASATATANLSRLRDETVKYYQQQKDLADLMGRSAAALRGTVADYRFSQLNEAAQYAQRLGEYDRAYSMALSTTGQARAGYADAMNAVLPQLLELAETTGNTNAIATLLARAEAVAKGLEDTLPRNYQAESLGLLADIDSSLAALGDGTQILVRAIDAGRDKTADGLRAVVAALTGQTVPAFAAGGAYAGGLALVGERGPELINFDQPGQIYNAAQTSALLSASNISAMVAELSALRREVSALRAESRQGDAAIASNTGKLARYADRWDGEGLPVRNADDTTLQTEAV